MKILLKQDFKTIGKKGTIKEVSDGYAMNYLIPNKIAVVYNEQEKLIHQQELEQQKIEEERKYANALELKGRLESLTLKFQGIPNQHGYLTGTISTKDIKKELEQTYNIKLDKKVFNDSTIINTFGLNHYIVDLHKKVKATLNILVEDKKAKK